MCDFTIFTVPFNGYSEVCGTLRAYQKDSTHAFRASVNDGMKTIGISPYVDGILLT